MPVIYIDVLFLTNFIFDLILLSLTGRLCRRSASAVRQISGAAVGALGGSAMFFLSVGKIMSVSLSVIMAFLMLTATFLPFSRHEFFRLTCGFYLSAFLVGGSLSAIFFFSGNPAVMSNGVYYFPLSLWQLIAAGLPVAAILCIGWKKTENRLTFHQNHVTVEIVCSGRKVRLEGLIDTGCSLADPVTCLPAMVIDASSAQKLEPDNFREIAVSTVNSRATLPTFLPDKCEITTDKGVLDCRCIVVLSTANLKGKAIINPEILLNWRKKYELPTTDRENPKDIGI